MEIYPEIFDWTPPDTGCAIALGRFDGVHLGHRALLERAVEHANLHDLVPVCFSFLESSFPGASERGQLTTDEEKIELLAQIGIRVLLYPTFAPPLIEMTAMGFLDELLIGRWRAKLLVAGYDFHFGKDRGGDADFLRREGESRGVEVEIFIAYEVGGIPVKATDIRNFIAEGLIENANALLGRPYSIRSKSRGGRRFGTHIGFPTVNFAVPDEKVKPHPGVYAVRMKTDVFPDIASKDRPLTLDGVANYGFRPTVEPENTEPLLEVHILEWPDENDFPSEIPPDTPFEIQFLRFIRPERKFASVDELKLQIALDCDIAREYFGSGR